MDRGRGWTRSALWGGIALGVGTVLYALCSPTSVGCATNLVVLTHSTVTARGCALYSVLAHIGVGLIVLGAVLMMGSFVLVVRHRRRAVTTDAVDRTATEPTAQVEDVVVAPPAFDGGTWTRRRAGDGAGTCRRTRPDPAAGHRAPVVERRPPAPRRPERAGPIAPGEDDAGVADPILLPPGWYGNPDNPGGPVQWWDGTKLVDRPR